MSKVYWPPGVNQEEQQALLDKMEFDRRDALWVYENHAHDMCADEIFAYGDMGEDSTKYLRATPEREAASESYEVLKDINEWLKTDQGGSRNLRYKPPWVDALCAAIALADGKGDECDS